MKISFSLELSDKMSAEKISYSFGFLFYISADKIFGRKPDFRRFSPPKICPIRYAKCTLPWFVRYIGRSSSPDREDRYQCCGREYSATWSRSKRYSTRARLVVTWLMLNTCWRLLDLCCWISTLSKNSIWSFFIHARIKIRIIPILQKRASMIHEINSNM